MECQDGVNDASPRTLPFFEFFKLRSRLETSLNLTQAFFLKTADLHDRRTICRLGFLLCYLAHLDAKDQTRRHSD